jgi:hypothetical protein
MACLTNLQLLKAVPIGGNVGGAVDAVLTAVGMPEDPRLSANVAPLLTLDCRLVTNWTRSDPNKPECFPIRFDLMCPSMQRLESVQFQVDLMESVEHQLSIELDVLPFVGFGRYEFRVVDATNEHIASLALMLKRKEKPARDFVSDACGRSNVQQMFDPGIPDSPDWSKELATRTTEVRNAYPSRPIDRHTCVRYADMIEELVHEIRSKGISVSSTSRLARAHAKLRHLASGTIAQPSRLQLVEYANSIQLGSLAKPLCVLVQGGLPSNLLESLRRFLKGSLHDSQASVALQAQSEIAQGVLLCASGEYVRSVSGDGKSPDYLIGIDGNDIAVEVKRPNRTSAIKAKLSEAVRQCEQSPADSCAVIIDVSDCVPTDLFESETEADANMDGRVRQHIKMDEAILDAESQFLDFLRKYKKGRVSVFLLVANGVVWKPQALLPAIHSNFIFWMSPSSDPIAAKFMDSYVRGYKALGGELLASPPFPVQR